MRWVYKFEAMTTPCELILISGDKHRTDNCAKAILTEAKRLEKKFNYYDPDSLLSRINRRQTDELDAETKAILQRAVKYYALTDRIFDITVATIKELFRNEKAHASLLEKQTALMPYVGCDHFKLKKNRIVFDNPHTKIDLGGFVKELAVDHAVRITRKYKIASALINFGGDVYALGRREDGTKFRVGIKNPSDPSKHIAWFELEEEALATSASYERSYLIEDRTYSHIIAGGGPALTPPLSATVISANCVESGVYATALMINPEFKTDHRTFLVQQEDS